MKKQPQVTEQTRANLTRAFWNLYLEKPIEKITVREITDRAGYNRATFYLYFRDVYDLLEQIEEGVLAPIRQLVQERLMRGDTLDFSQHMGAVAALAQRFNTVLPRLLSHDPSFGVRLTEAIAPLLDRFILPGGALTESEQDVLRAFYLSGLLAAITRWLEDPGDMSIERLIELVVNVVVPPGSAPRDGAGPLELRFQV